MIWKYTDRLAVLSAHGPQLAKRILDDYRPGAIGIEEHFNNWVRKHIETDKAGRVVLLTDIERRALFFRVTHTENGKVRVIPGKDGKPDRWTSATEPACAVDEGASRQISLEA